jgi:transposase InsO family protein
MDVCGPLQMKTYSGNIYFTVFVDEYTRYEWVYLHRTRTQALEILERFVLDATKGTNSKIVELLTDQASEFLSHEYRAQLTQLSISLQCSAAYSHHQNGYAERYM